MDRGLVFFTIAIVFAYLILDELFGYKKVISKIANMLTPGMPSVGDMAKDAAQAGVDSVKDGVKEQQNVAKESQKNTNEMIKEQLDKLRR